MIEKELQRMIANINEKMYTRNKWQIILETNDHKLRYSELGHLTPTTIKK